MIINALNNLYPHKLKERNFAGEKKRVNGLQKKSKGFCTFGAKINSFNK